VISLDKGANWKRLPRTDDDTVTPSSACVKIDPNSGDTLFIPSSKGIAVSFDAGFTFSEINTGLTAVQIRDMVLDEVSSIGWAVAKSGIRKVTNYDTDPVWSLPMDPAGEDWAWYDTVDMDKNDPTGNTSYVSTRWGDRVFKTTDGGENWRILARPEPEYEPPPPDEEGGWQPWPRWEGQTSAIKIDQYSDGERILVGYDAEHYWMPMEGEYFDIPYGQLWVVEDSGSTWTQIFLRNDEATSNTIVGDEWNIFMQGDINIDDILITQESNETVIYVTAHYLDETATAIDPWSEEMYSQQGRYDHRTGLPYVYKIYRITGDTTSGWTVSEDLSADDLNMVALAKSSNGTLYACGKTFDEDIYDAFLETFQEEFKAEMKQHARLQEKERFYDELSYELYNHIYNEIHGEFPEDYNPEDMYNPEEEGPPDDGSAEPAEDDGMYEMIFQLWVSELYEEYFEGWEWDADGYEAYFEDAFDDYFYEVIGPEFDTHFDESFDQYFHMDWDHMKPAKGLRVVYQKELGGDWAALPMKGLNKSQSFHHHFDEVKEVITVGQDPFDPTLEIPFVGFNKYLYYLPGLAEDGEEEGNTTDDREWIKGYVYPAGTEIHVIVGVADTASETEAASLDQSPSASPAYPYEVTSVMYLGTGTGVYEQPIEAASLAEQEIPEGDSTVEIPEQSLILDDPDLGEASVSIIIDIVDAPEGATISLTIITDADASKIRIGEDRLYTLFDNLASDEDFTIADIAYVLEIAKENLTDENIADATLTFKIGRAWANEYGTSLIKVFRVADDGTMEILPTEFVDYERDQAVFEAEAANGLSYFGLVAVEGAETAEIMGLPLSWVIAVIAAAIVVLGAILFLLWRKRRGPEELEPVPVVSDIASEPEPDWD
jgi:hypothetical protein